MISSIATLVNGNIYTGSSSITGTTSTIDDAVETVILAYSDNTAPVANVASLADATGECSATIASAPTATDACAGTIIGTTTDPLTRSTQGTYYITWNFDDGNGNDIDVVQTVIVDDVTFPSIACANDIEVSNDDDICGAVVNYATPVGTDNCSGSITLQTSGLPSGSEFPVGTTTNTFLVTDVGGNTATCSFSVTVTNAAPVVTITAPDPTVIPINTTITLTVDIVDNNLVSTIVDWGDGIVETNQPLSHKYVATGVNRITVTVTDACGATDEEVYEFIVVYDPTAGFVTGGGWINSIAGAYRPDLLLTGKATFGFVSKYEKGKQVPSGNTEFQFHAAGMNFKSKVYDWLVIAGSKAQFKGTGTINGLGDYGFILSAIDAALTPSTSIDLFRIKIWDISSDNIVYDNNYGVADNGDPSTAIGGGSIVIHSNEKVTTTAKTKSAEIATAIEPLVEAPEMQVYPNPFSSKLNFRFVSPEAVNARIDMYDMTGRMVQTVFNSPVEGGVYYNAEFKPETVISGMYLYRMTLGNEVYNGKVVYKK